MAQTKQEQALTKAQLQKATSQVGDKMTKANALALQKQGLSASQIQQVANAVGKTGKGALTQIDRAAAKGQSGGGRGGGKRQGLDPKRTYPEVPFESTFMGAANAWGRKNADNDLVKGAVNDLISGALKAGIQTDMDVYYANQMMPLALTYQRGSQNIMTEADVERMGVEGKITERLMDVQGGYQLKDTAIQANAQKYGYDKQAQASMYGADANLAAARAAAEAQLGSAQAAADADKFGYAQQAQASMYGADKSAQASMYGADKGAEASMYGADRGAEASMYGADRQVDVAGIEADAAKYGYDKQAQASMYGADRNLEGVRAQADAQRYGYDKQLEGTKYGADRNLEGTKYATDSSERVAFGGYASAEKQIGLRGAEDRKTLRQGTDETLRLRADARGAIQRAGARFYG